MKVEWIQVMKKDRLNWPLEAARLSGRSFIPSSSGDILSLIKCSLLTYHFTKAWSHQFKRRHWHWSTQSQNTKEFHNFSDYFANCRWSGGGGVCLLQPGEQRGHLCFEDSSTSVSTLSRHHGYYRPWSSVFQPSCLLVIFVLRTHSYLSRLNLGIIDTLGHGHLFISLLVISVMRTPPYMSWL